ncbi:MAG: hypothetical protein RLZZ337_842 [Bacteroidota bacterium]
MYYIILFIRAMKHFGIAFILAATAFVIYALRAPRFVDKDAFYKTKNDWHQTDNVLFLKTVEKHLTFKHKAIAYAATFYVAGLVLLYLQKNIRTLKSAANPRKVLVIGIIAIVSGFVAFILSNLWLEYNELLPPNQTTQTVFRNELAPLSTFYILWFGIHVPALLDDYNTNFPFLKLGLSYINVLYFSTTIMAAGFMFVCIAGGQFFYFLSSLIWVYFHLLVLSGKRSSIPMKI